MTQKTPQNRPRSGKPAPKGSFKSRPKAKPAPKPQAKPQAGTPEGDRIAKVLARAGVASRREAEKLITAGVVAVNGKVIDSPALNVTARDRITVDGQPLAAAEPMRLWLYHKPTGLVTTHKDEQGRPTIYENLPEYLPRVMSVGRLDLNSEGLLLLTNDGELKRKLELPSTGWLRKYRVRVNGRPTDETLEPLRKGIEADGEIFQPMIVNLDRQQGANAWLTVGLREGKNREIRRAMQEIGLNVNRLLRVSYGPFQLGQLKEGEVEEVRPRILRDQLGLGPAPETEETPAKPGKPAAKRRPPRVPRRKP
ncbi:pseudouridine synthase [Donghicola sp.]|jgi:23S rRNA pseudouridine2605 synthase|uniref:pseudouridine synthase n=1 Tax=Donghicola sp. TaxID=1929294 RepID=UPI0025EE088F|nr:pseudouridine synthase [Donghicola sp.]MCT4576121.1 rRNA pseudouridine synthase [Donghicola sp.]